jgi:hypothetical protein
LREAASGGFFVCCDGSPVRLACDVEASFPRRIRKAVPQAGITGVMWIDAVWIILARESVQGWLDEAPCRQR